MALTKWARRVASNTRNQLFEIHRFNAQPSSSLRIDMHNPPTDHCGRVILFDRHFAVELCKKSKDELVAGVDPVAGLTWQSRLVRLHGRNQLV
jgi:hypothetical protein